MSVRSTGFPPTTPGGAGSIDALTASLTALSTGNAALSAATPFFNFKRWSFGIALGVGLTLTSCGKFTNLAAAQVVFPHATAMSNRVDWCALQGAINAAAAAGAGTVYMPYGSYTSDQPIVLPSSFISSTGFTGAEVNLLGDGNFTSWTAVGDFGAGSFLLSCGPVSATPANGTGRFGGNTTYVGYCQGFALLSTYTKIVKGMPPMLQGTTTTIGMSGFAAGARRRLRDVYIANFLAGVDYVGDHTLHQGIVCENNYYGIYFSNPNTSLYGDLEFHKCSFTGAFAGIGISANAGVTAEWHSCYFGSQPFAIVKEAGSGSGVGLSGSKFVRCQFENLGNGMLKDLNAYGTAGTSSTTTSGITTGTGTKTCIMREVECDGECYFSWNTGNRITQMYWPAPGAASNGTTVAVGYEDIIDVSALELCRFAFSSMVNWTPGSRSILDCANIGSSGNPGAVFEGNIDGMLANCSIATPFATGVNYPMAKLIRFVSPGRWEGNCWDTQSGSTLFPQNAVAGDVAEQSYGEAVIGGATGSNIANFPPLGIFMAPCAPGQIAVLARTGQYIPVNLGGGQSGSNNYLRKSLRLKSAVPNAAGSGYAVGDTIALAGGTRTIAAVLTVQSLTSGGTGVATVSVSTVGDYSSLPTGTGQLTQASTSGSGTGANFTGTINFGKSAIASSFTDTSGGPLYGVGHDGFGSGVTNGQYSTVRF